MLFRFQLSEHFDFCSVQIEDAFRTLAAESFQRLLQMIQKVFDRRLSGVFRREIPQIQMNRRIGIAIRSILVNLNRTCSTIEGAEKLVYRQNQRMTSDDFIFEFDFFDMFNGEFRSHFLELSKKVIDRSIGKRSSYLFVRFLVFDFFHFRFVRVHRLFDFFDLIAE